ncbi:GLPGLI family protein [Chryseobacterium sp.]|uniref:GLPGLI family protein n=1 Tax=Chryseobacterium sp. TaxID=1871047 RepID=UPI0025B8ACAC|nr:GLPGLI family protein [Chryseobacterium sp.]
MKNIFLLFVLINTWGIAQTNRFFYEYKFIPDSTNKAEVKKEIMLLDIDKNGSNYYSYDKFVADSTAKADIERQLKSGSGNININKREKPGAVTFRVTKNYPDFTTYLFRNIGTDRYKIKEDVKPEWKIEPEKAKIGEYNTQKAITSFGGRQWIAWFTTDVPFQDGPYKFYGLPGLIIKIEDKTGSHSMTLIGNKKIQTPIESELNLPGNLNAFAMGGKEVEITKDQFKKAWKAYANDPSKNMREMMMRNGGDGNMKTVVKLKTSDGKELSDPNQIYREIEKKTKENLKKDNNQIEPDLFR